ncbi:MAG TPA: hypothetical protein PKC80_09005 [Burkholderiaceae bacterium]|nr:hypothetical protein [Burkholderiaceae bacterium]
MTKKIIYITLAALLGASLGAFLSYGPLKRFKSEAAFNIDINIAGYKRFAQMVNDPAQFRRYAVQIKPQALTEEQIKITLKDITNANWLKPVPRFSKFDVKDLADLAVRLEQESIRRRELESANEIDMLFGNRSNLIRNENSSYTGLYISIQENDPVIANNKLSWLSDYALDTVAYSAVDMLLDKWNSEDKLFAENYQVAQIQQEFVTEQLKMKIAGLKKALASPPAIAKAKVDNLAIATVNQSNGMTPRSQLLYAELELLELESIKHKVSRKIEHQKIANQITQQISIPAHIHRTGHERINSLDDLLTNTLTKIKQPSQREKLLLMRMEVSNLKSSLSTKPSFILQASESTQIGSNPLKIIAICSMFFALLMSLFIWRKEFMKHLIQDPSALSVQK